MTKAKPISDLAEALTSLNPCLDPVIYEYVAGMRPDAVVVVQESEGVCCLAPTEQGTLRRITLGALTSLELVGLTAVVAVALTRAGIPANVVAGLKHDHLFVPRDLSEQAMSVLQNLPNDPSVAIADMLGR